MTSLFYCIFDKRELWGKKTFNAARFEVIFGQPQKFAKFFY